MVSVNLLLGQANPIIQIAKQEDFLAVIVGSQLAQNLDEVAVAVIGVALPGVQVGADKAERLHPQSKA